MPIVQNIATEVLGRLESSIILQSQVTTTEDKEFRRITIQYFVIIDQCY